MRSSINDAVFEMAQLPKGDPRRTELGERLRDRLFEKLKNYLLAKHH